MFGQDKSSGSLEKTRDSYHSRRLEPDLELPFWRNSAILILGRTGKVSVAKVFQSNCGGSACLNWPTSIFGVRQGKQLELS
jgi:hypothetical protein